MQRDKLFHLGLILSYCTSGLMILYAFLGVLCYINEKASLALLGVIASATYGPVYFVVPATTFTIGLVFLITTHFGIKNKVAWGWLIFLTCITFNPIVHLIFQIKNGVFPFSIYTLLFGIPAVALTGSAIFAKK